MKKDKPEDAQIVRIDQNNIKDFPKIETLFNSGKVRFDSSGRLRHLHGAPVGDMIFYGLDDINNPIYKESAQEWFDPESQKAKNFIWE